jgi:hypothetical protein
MNRLSDRLFGNRTAHPYLLGSISDCRIIDLNGTPWFVAADVLKCPGLQTGSGMHTATPG